MNKFKDIHVTSIDRVWPLCGAVHAHNLLSLSTHKGIKKPPQVNNHLILEFDDITSPSIGFVMPTKRFVEQILEFGKNIKDQEITVLHCTAGISRSTAALVMILVQKHGIKFVRENLDDLIAIRPIMMPNSLMLRFADEIMGLGGQLVKMGEVITAKTDRGSGYMV